MSGSKKFPLAPEELTDEQKASQMLLVYYTTREFALKHEFGGVLLMKPAFRDINQLKKDLLTLKTAASITPFIAVDHEGGAVNRLNEAPDWESTLSAKQLSKLSIPEIYQQSSLPARYLADLGINLNFAPVLDPAINEKKQQTWMGIRQRSFGTTPTEIVPAASAYMQAFKRYGILSVVKHFPGYASTRNSDSHIVIENTSVKALETMQQSFKQTARISIGTMMSNITYSKVSNKPAVISSKFTEKARQTNPDGLLFTDDLWAEGIKGWVKADNKSDDQKLLEVTREAILAGNDVLIITFPQKAVLMKNSIIKWMKEDKQIKNAVDRAVKRILHSKHLIGQDTSA